MANNDFFLIYKSSLFVFLNVFKGEKEFRVAEYLLSLVILGNNFLISLHIMLFLIPRM